MLTWKMDTKNDRNIMQCVDDINYFQEQCWANLEMTRKEEL